jgi:hypothetical protein
MGSGRAATASCRFALLSLPIELVGHDTIAIRARSASPSAIGWRPTTDCPSRRERVNTSGATTRHVSQSMHESSTKRSPGAFSLARADLRAIGDG